MSKLYRQKLVTNAHFELYHHCKSNISRWNMVSQAWQTVTNPQLCARTFGLDIGIVEAMSAQRCCECEANSSKKIGKTTNMTSTLKPADQSEFIPGGPVSLIYRVWKVAVVIHVVFTSYRGIRQSKLPCHATCDRRVADGFLWCTRVFVSLSKQKESHLGNPGVGIGQFNEFAIYLYSYYIMIRYLSMPHTDCYHVIIGIKPCHQKLALSVSPRE